jgi:hypothetical protein
MLTGLPALIDSIFGKQDLSSVSLDEIRDVIAEFPSFNAAHYLLSKKLQLQDDDAYEKQSMRTALYFNNALWLKTILEAGDEAILSPAKSVIREKISSDYDDSETVVSSPVFPDSVIPEPLNFEIPEPISQSLPVFGAETENYTYTEIRTTEEKFLEIEKPVEDFSTKPEPTVESTSEYISEYGIFEDQSSEGKYIDNDSFDRPTDHSHSGENHVDLRIEPEKTEENETIVENDNGESFVEDDVDRDAEAFDREVDRTDSISETTDASNPDFTSGNEIVVQESELPSDQPVQPVKAFDAKNAESIVFAPYHMVDYFASQGIKLVLEDQPSDSFGKQLKSFTDWLKVMKKVPVKSRSDKADDKETDRIRHFASHSLEDRDILTESMAEVLAKQGMYENAIALYQKLSLIYPPKSAYFVSRIEQLKAKLP